MLIFVSPPETQFIATTLISAAVKPRISLPFRAGFLNTRWNFLFKGIANSISYFLFEYLNESMRLPVDESGR